MPGGRAPRRKAPGPSATVATALRCPLRFGSDGDIPAVSARQSGTTWPAELDSRRRATDQACRYGTMVLAVLTWVPAEGWRVQCLRPKGRGGARDPSAG